MYLLNRNEIKDFLVFHQGEMIIAAFFPLTLLVSITMQDHSFVLVGFVRNTIMLLCCIKHSYKVTWLRG